MEDDAYEIVASRPREEAVTMPMVPSLPDEEEAKPSWACQYEKERSAAQRRLKGTVAKWDAKGWGFITRADGMGDIFVHQRSLNKSGFRSLLVGESVEFEAQAGNVAGKLEAVNVTGPGGAEVIGQPSSSDDRRRNESDSDSEEVPKPKHEAEPEKPPITSRKTTSFMPRNLKRPNAVPAGRSIPLPKAKMSKTAEPSSAGSNGANTIGFTSGKVAAEGAVAKTL
eukprot:scaffold3372_cov29-Tisochrysis_lutea.AAC.1